MSQPAPSRSDVISQCCAAAMQTLERRILFCTLDHEAGEFGPFPETAETEPNDSLATATPVIAADTLSGSLSNASDQDYYSHAMNAGDRISVQPGTDPGQRHYQPLVEILDPTGAVITSSSDGHIIYAYAITTGTYYVRVTSPSVYGTYTGSYSTVVINHTNYSGTTETEPNDTATAANSIGSTSLFRGNLSSVLDADAFSFSANSGTPIVIKFATAPSQSPSVRLYNPSNVLVATDTTGLGLIYNAPSTGTYKAVLGTDNNAGPVSGDYVVSEFEGGSTITAETEPNGTFSTANAFTLSTSTRTVTGMLDALTDVDVYSFNFSAGKKYTFSLNNTNVLGTTGRTLTLFNQFGQFVETGLTGSINTDAATGFGFRIEHSGRYFLAVRAMLPNALGPYSISASQTSFSFPTQRDVPLYFHDYTGQTTHLGYGPAAPLANPAANPLFLGMFESRYDIYDVDTTTTLPTGSFVSFGAGEFGSIGAYGYGGNFSLGTRRVSGDSVLDDAGSAFNSFVSMYSPARVMHQETDHATGLYAHARNLLAYMSYDAQSALNVIGTYFPFPWTDSRVPDVESRNEREFMDWVLQAGRIAEEVESNNTPATAQSLASFMSEMTGDADPRNDRVAISGNLSSNSDLDYYSFTASAGQKFMIDVDSAEFQYPLDATLQLFDSGGNLLATSTDAVDRDSGLHSVDPNLMYTFGSAGTYRVLVSAARGTSGNYRLKLTSGAALDTRGPRVLASWPNGGASDNSMRQLVFWMNDQIDPATVSSSNIIVSGTATGVRSGKAIFDPTDSVLLWVADSPLPNDSYTVTFKSGANGLKDLKGNQLDGETDGSMSFPEISGNGTPGGDFVTNFVITSQDTTPASVSTPTIRRHPYNRVQFRLQMSDDMDVQSVHTAGIVVRGAGADNTYGTGDDFFVPSDVLYDKATNQSSRSLYLNTRGAISDGNYRVEGTVKDAAGNNVVLSTSFTYNSGVSNGNLQNGPSVAGLSVRPGSSITSPLSRFDIQFGKQVNPASLTTANVVLRYSPNNTFFDGDDVLIADANGVIDWDPVNLRATFEAASVLSSGYYLVELNGQAGGITDPSGRLLDGEYLDTGVNGLSLFSHWQDTPSGDGLAGGDYRAVFTVAPSLAAPSAPDLIAASDTGTSSTDNLTRLSSPTFAGTAPAGSLVTIYSDGVAVGAGVADGSGNYSVTTGLISDGSHQITATATSGTSASDLSSPLTITIDSVAPTIGAGAFAYLTQHAISFSFSEDVQPAIAFDDLVLTNVTSSTIVPAGNMSMNYVAGTRTATWTFPGYANGVLPDGDYSGAIAASAVTDAAGNELLADGTVTFFFLNGDATRNRAVGGEDFNVLATNFGGTGRNFSQGNFSYDAAGNVDSADFNILATNFGVTLVGEGELSRGSSGLPGGAGGAGSGSSSLFGGGRIGDDDEDGSSGIVT